MSQSRDPLDPGAQKQHFLPAEQAEDIFTRHIAPTLLAFGEPQEQPVVIVLSAQPAAGKTAITRLLRATFDDSGGAVGVDVDELIAFHPDLPGLRAADELTAEDLVHADARRWLARAVDHLIQRQVNIVLEHGLRSREVTEDLLGDFAAAGYRIEAVLLATPAAQSLLGNLGRYQTAHESTGSGRYVLPELHDTRYAQLLQVADWLQDDPRVQAVAAYRRDGTLLARNERGADSGWQDPARLRQVIQAERERRWTVGESNAFLTLHAGLAARMAPAWTPALQRALEAAAPLLHPDAPGPDTPPPAADGPAITAPRQPRPRPTPGTRRPDRPSPPPPPPPPPSPRRGGPAR
ncbi:MAG TPA: zeta toxin family protein [Kineosporiaceae bacterium]|nr:zeta toxin family protein [Kineosporiaceae bacterium]